MKISFKEHKTKFLRLEHIGASEEENLEVIKDFSFGTGFPDFGNSYSIIFNITILTECGHEVSAEFHALFETDEDLDDEMRKSKFILINSPAIAYPYLRAYISNICLLSGYSPVILPTLNFQVLYNENHKER